MKRMLLLSVAFVLVNIAPAMGQAVLVTTRPGTANDNGSLTYWCTQVGPPGTYNFGDITTLAGPVPVTLVWGGWDEAYVFTEGTGGASLAQYYGNFLQNDCLLEVHGPAVLNLSVSLNPPVSQFGLQLDNPYGAPLGIQIAAYDASHKQIATFSVTLPSHTTLQDGSAPYLGIADYSSGQPVADISTMTYGTQTFGEDGFFINEPSVTVPNDSSCYTPPNTTMVAWYPFDEPSPLTTSSNLATGNSGTQVNGPLGVTAGEVAGAAGFNGTNQFVESPSTIATNFGPGTLATNCVGPEYSGSGSYSTCLGNFSIDTWVNIPATAPPGVMAILDKRSDSPLLGYHFFVYSGASASNKQYFGLQLADLGGYSNYSSADVTLYDGMWHHLAVTVNRTAPNGIIFYLDGVAKGQATAGHLGSLVNNSPLRIGTRTAAPPLTGWFQGKLDELEIYNRELTGSEVSLIYSAGSHGKCK